MAVWGPKNGRRALERDQLSLNKFYDPSAPSMRKVDDGEKKRKKEKNGVFSGHYVIASSLPPERLRLRPNDDRWNAARSCQKYGDLSIYNVFQIVWNLCSCKIMFDKGLIKL